MFVLLLLYVVCVCSCVLCSLRLFFLFVNSFVVVWLRLFVIVCGLFVCCAVRSHRSCPLPFFLLLCGVCVGACCLNVVFRVGGIVCVSVGFVLVTCVRVCVRSC